MQHSGHHHASPIGKKLWFTIFLNGLITVAQVIAGFAGNSLSLLSDALHNFSDVLALVLSYLALHLTSRKSTLQKTFGYKRAEILAAFINTASLLAIAVLLCKEAITRLMQTAPPVESFSLITLGIMSVLINLWSVMLLRHEAKHSLNVRSAYLHLFSDILSSFAVVAGGLAIQWTKLYWIDSLLSIAIACYLVYSSWSILIDITRIIMHFTPDHINLEELEKDLLSQDKLANIHHVHVWQLNDQEVHFEAHIDFEEDLPLSEVSQTINKIRLRLHEKFGIRHTVIQPEIGVQDSKKLIVTECHH